MGEEKDGLLMIIIYTSLCIYMLLSWWKFGRPCSQMKLKVKGWNTREESQGQKGKQKKKKEHWIFIDVLSVLLEYNSSASK